MIQNTPQVGRALKHMYLLYVKIVDKKMREHDLTYAQSDLLCQLDKVDGQTQAELSDRLGISAPTLSNSADSLEKKGFVRRQASDKDARQKQLYLTDKGHDILPTILKINDDIQQNITTNLSPAEQALLGEWIRSMHEQLLEQAKN